MMSGLSIPSTRAAIAITVSTASVFLAYLGSSRWWGGLLSFAVLAWFSLAGVAFARKLLQSDNNHSHWLFGPVWGAGISAVGMLVLWQFGLHGWWILVVAPWPLWLMLLLPLKRIGAGLSLPVLDRRDALAVALLFLLVPLISARPYANVGAIVDGGAKAYRAYFTADFVWAMTVVAEVSKGDLPPKNPFITDGTLNYYWLAHFLSAVEYRVFGPLGLSIEEVTLADSVGFSFIFLAFLYGFVRAFGSLVVPAACACALVFLANSFEGLDRVFAWWDSPSIWKALNDINVDAVTRWFYAAMPVDGLHRMFLYQPHHLGGYAIGLSALLIVAKAERVDRPLLALVIGCFLGLSLMLTSFTAILMGVAVSIVYAVRLLWPPKWLAIPLCAVMGALPVLAAVKASQVLAYVDPAATTIIFFGANPVALNQWPYALLLSFGPMLLLGTVGLIVAIVRRQWAAWPVAVLGLIALLSYFLVDVPDMQHVWVGWRAGHLLFITFTVFTALLFTIMASASDTAKLTTAVFAILLTLAALPTTVVDLFNAQDITNAGQGPSFPWTLRLSRHELEAFTWLKTHTPPDVVVQPDVQARGGSSWGYLPAFGERRMAAGLPIAMIPMKPYEDASALVGDAIFTRGTAGERAAVAARMKIDYLWLGPREQHDHPEMVALLETRSDLFPVAFRNEEVVVYQVAQHAAGQ